MPGYMQYFRDLREDSDKSQKEVAEYLGISQTVYSRYERGKNELPMRHFSALCKYFGASADYVLELQPEYNRNSSSNSAEKVKD